MGDQTVFLVDKNDKFIGYASRSECHRGQGKRHRAFVTLLFDENDNVILQRRKHRLFDNLWDLTAISHPLSVDGRDESYQEASDRALLKEMGIGHVEVGKMGAFNYFAKDGKNCENEYCAVLVGNWDGQFRPSRNEVYEAKKVKFVDFIADIQKNPKKYTPWAVKAAKTLKKSSPNLLSIELLEFLAVFEPYAKAYFANKIRWGRGYSPLVSRFYKDLANFSEGGKKLRAFLAWLGYQVGESSKVKVPADAKALAGRQSSKLRRILPIALAFEMAQNFLLIHDDIMDNSDLRRGKPTIHKIYEKGSPQSLKATEGKIHYGESMAIILGDIASIEIFNLVNHSKFSEGQKVMCQKLFANVLLETAFGQALDIEFGHVKSGFGQIMQIADLKSARYSVVGPMVIGASLSGAKKSQIEALKRYGLSVGLAYQLEDDVLGVFGDEKILGKSTLSDLREGKNTMLIYKTKQLVGGKDKEVIEQIWGKRDGTVKDLEKVRGIIEKSGALKWCQEENSRLAAKAKGEIKGITRDMRLSKIFEQIADFVISRQK